MNLPDPAPVVDLIDAFRRSKTMFTAVSLGIFDHLAETPAGAEELAGRIGANPDALARLLDACVGLGFLRRDAGIYYNQPVAATYLCRSSPHALTGYILYSDQVLYRLWTHLDDALREGTHRWHQAFGLDPATLFENFFRDDDAMRTFLRGMHGFGLLSSPKVVAAFDLSRFRCLADLGGATGHLAVAACERYSGLRGIVLDLPRVIEVARDYIQQSAARDRIDLVAGDFFADPLPSADLYSLGRILHDWSVPKIHRLLTRIYDCLPPGGGLLVAEKLLQEDRSGPVAAHMQSLNMLCCTEGKERTLAEYTTLLTRAGFTRIEGCRTGAPLDAVLAIRN
ncbi:MAG TPA: class I SAM-dependent methyltransferase [Bryobacteraceae bacterium]|nr:class I SAM-dependent methyltransferase [Bryobacteraceae bacterium]